ncbi:hypothetical protein L228DRAFT_245442 [Xylona heveae TC161]|uniref:Uncharacterized protein n=1 Tax=Xylona heveae (strain CBS 132557 / TC161) TaxID=1328760 RepID=A0A161TQA1_XYLHT|nr:hypothetical protein L228DRAFT_245442 [Xylona heveae TC161]KZF24496.1 hypothetical protein L228DRAFT_245442 [Xylona heveae TC161]
MTAPKCTDHRECYYPCCVEHKISVDQSLQSHVVSEDTIRGHRCLGNKYSPRHKQKQGLLLAGSADEHISLSVMKRRSSVCNASSSGPKRTGS